MLDKWRLHVILKMSVEGCKIVKFWWILLTNYVINGMVEWMSRVTESNVCDFS